MILQNIQGAAMRRTLLVISLLGLGFVFAKNIFAQIDLGGMIERKTEERVDAEANKAADAALDSAEDAITGKKKNPPPQNTGGKQNTNTNTSSSSGSGAAPANMKAYANYDFIPGDKILFEDNFMSDQDGEFPAHWDLTSGQAIVNRVSGEPAFLLTDGNYAVVFPRMKEKQYLPADFTVEFDQRPTAQSFGTIVRFIGEDGSNYDQFFGTDGEIKLVGKDKELVGTYSGYDPETYRDKWHHCAIVVKGQQMKAYVDQFRICVMPNINGAKFSSTQFAGIGDQNNPVVFKNVRIAAGGGMNMIDKLSTDGKIVTHGILFDIGKATLKPESMGTLNAISKLMKENVNIKFEVGGHTDSDGSAQLNQKLSDDRANAVRKSLIDMGIDAARLTAKGYGSSKPIDKNDSPEGKANNRRVEFVKM
jgi:outer membrane protein OmpA-like peptidoglycan-associated protein